VIRRATPSANPEVTLNHVSRDTHAPVLAVQVALWGTVLLEKGLSEAGDSREQE